MPSNSTFRCPSNGGFLRLENGVPSHDTFGRVFALLDPAQLVACIRQWLDEVGRQIGQHIAIDGKTLRGSFDAAAGRSPLHLVSAWASEARLTLGQVAVESKSNEITAVPRGGGYGVYRGTGGRRSAARPGRHVAVETNRGRRERHECYVLPEPKTLPDVAGWANLATIVMVLRITQADGRESGEVSYYLSSPPPNAKMLARLIRQHWSIESQLHWVLDVTFTEDASRIRQRHAPQTSAMLRRLAVSILQADTSLRDSLRGKRYRACLSTDNLERILLSFVEK